MSNIEEFWKIVFDGCNSTYRLRYWNTSGFPPRTTTQRICCNSTYRLRYWNMNSYPWCSRRTSALQQYLPFTVLKLSGDLFRLDFAKLQQYLPLAVLKRSHVALRFRNVDELQQYLPLTVLKHFHVTFQLWSDKFCCNSTYRLRYATKGARQQRSKATMRSAHL